MDESRDAGTTEPDAAPRQADERWDAARRRTVRDAFAGTRERQHRASQGMAALLMLTVAAGVLLRLPPSWWMPAVGAVALAGVVFRLANWKCPNCGERLSSRRSPSVCLGCGAPLE